MPTDKAAKRRKTTDSWLVWTSRDEEAPRRGFGQDALDATLSHLRSRGERRVKVQQTDIGPVVEVRLG